MVTFGFVFGFLLGVPVAIVDHWFGQWWLLPVLGVVVGWITNKLGMWLIFEPLEPKRILGIKAHGLFLRRQDEAAGSSERRRQRSSRRGSVLHPG